ncbi:prolyl oligopeptidase family serine peptidase [Ideonella sp. DXS22W]|uniref:Prolyl oligopeptidase family serine peptidase n=1 Tax=Pseudaquabacterium inlustre TaxID=2984192 RepID=A0ABU9CG46_9BURK
MSKKLHGLSRIAIGLAAACAAMGAAAQAGGPIKVPTVEQLAQHARVTGFQLSPDGKHLMAIESAGDVRQVLIWQTDNLAAKPRTLSSSSMRIRSASFLKNDVVAVTLWQPYDARLGGSVTKTFIEKLLITDLDGKTWKEPLEQANISRADDLKSVAALAKPSIRSNLAGDPDHVLVESDGNASDRDLFRYNVRTGTAARVMRLSENDIEVMVDGKGQPQAKSRAGNDSKGLYVATDLRDPDSGEWQEHFRSYVKERDLLQVVRVGTTPGTVVLRSNVGRDVTALYEYDVKARKNKGTLFEHRFFDATGARTVGSDDPRDGEGFDGFSYRGIYGNEVHWANPRLQAVVDAVAQSAGIGQAKQVLVDVSTGRRAEVNALDGATVTISGFHKGDGKGDNATYLLRVSGMNLPTEHYMLRGQRLSLLGKEFPQIDRRALGKSTFVYYPARDGLNIPAILTVPNAELCGKGPYPAVIHPHGGPWSRDTMDYDVSGWVPLMVSRCRVVLQPQYRGSADWGRALWLAGDAQWGQKMQDDKDDGAKWLAAQNLVDPKRVAMFGFSYGGYAAMAAAVRPMDLYKCAIAGAGVSDIERIWAAFYTNPFFRDRQEPTVRGLSPLSQADKIKIPIMVYHGERDQTVPLVQSELFVDKARKSGVPVEYHVLPDYGHGPAWTREIMTRQLAIIEQYLDKGCNGGL